MCDPGFSPAHEMIATCNNSGFWHPDPALLECQSKYIFKYVISTMKITIFLYIYLGIPTLPPPSSGNIAALAEGVAGGVLVVVLIILGTLVLLLVLRTKRKGIYNSYLM